MAGLPSGLKNFGGITDFSPVTSSERICTLVHIKEKVLRIVPPCAEKYKDDLGKVSVGKSCIRFNKLEDLDSKGLVKMLKLAAKFPGLSPA